MHFSALAVLACALVAVTARPVQDGSAISAVIPVVIADAANHNTLAVGNDILNTNSKPDGAVGNHAPRGAVNVAIPVTIEEIFDCNDISVANDILNTLAAELGCTVAFLGITVEDILACNPGNWHPLVDELYSHVGSPAGLGKRDDGFDDIVADVTNDLGDIDANVLDRRDVASVAIPVTIEEIFDCNDISVANNILNNLAAELGCTVAFLGITVADILGCNPGNWHPLVDELYSHVGSPAGLGRRDDGFDNIVADVTNDLAGLRKRDGVDAKAPVDVSNVANYNMVDILNKAGNAQGGKRQDANAGSSTILGLLGVVVGDVDGLVGLDSTPVNTA